jgi:hypothetical protein
MEHRILRVILVIAMVGVWLSLASGGLLTDGIASAAFYTLAILFILISMATTAHEAVNVLGQEHSSPQTQ